MKSVENFRYVEKTSAECSERSVMKTRTVVVLGNFTSLKSRIALQVARKIAPCNMALYCTKVSLLSRPSNQGW